MSGVGGGDIPKPSSEHASQILGTNWPACSESAWEHFATDLQNEGMRLFRESQGPQQDIYRLVATDQEGAFIDSAVRVIQLRGNTLENRYSAYKSAARSASAISSQIWGAKLKMAESVSAAEATITAARNELNPQIQAAEAAGQSQIAMQLKLELQARTNAAITLGQDEVTAAAGLAAGEIGTQQLGLANWKAPNTMPSNTGGTNGASPMSNGLGGAPAAPAPTLPASGGGGFENVDNSTDPGEDNHQLTALSATNHTTTPADGQQQGPIVKPTAATTPNGVAGSQGQPGAATTPAQAASGASGPGSLIGHLMSPLSSAGGGSSAGSGGSPLSSMGSGLGNFGNAGGANPGSAQPASMMNPGAAGLPGAGTGAGTGAGVGAGAGAGQGAGLAGLGSGAAETSAKLAAGAVNAASNGLGAVANAGSQVAQNVAPAVAQVAAQSAPLGPAASTSPASVGGMGGGPAMGMMPGGAMGGAPPVTPVAGGSPVAPPAVPPSGPPAAPPSAGGAPPAMGGVPPGAQYAPLAMPQAHGGGVRAIGADGATGSVLVDQAATVGADLIAAMMTQTALAGYISIDFAVSLIYERTGGVTAWLATSEGASAIPLGIRIPQDVKLAVNDPVIGRDLWSTSAAGGGANPLQIITEHAKAREMAAVGTTVLAIASATPGVDGWAKEVNARAVQLDAASVRPVADLGHTLHRCEVAMPWEWRQANAFDAHDRLRIAARHMHMAMTAGHLHGAASEQVLRLFEQREPISDELWDGVHKDRMDALVKYDLAKMRLSFGAPELARLLATVRAAEVIESLRHYDTVEGCADLLYSTRLAGAPLSPDAAVTQ